MTTGVARGGGEAILSTPGPVASVYYSPSNQPVGVSAGSFGPKQKVTAVALETPASLQAVQIRAIGLKTVDEPGFNSAGGEGKLYGIFGRIGASPAFGLLFEAARGKFTPNPGSTETEREGNAYRLGLTGTRGTFSYAFNLRRTEANFVNPANRGFTVGGVADREGADLTLTKGVRADDGLRAAPSHPRRRHLGLGEPLGAGERRRRPAQHRVQPEGDVPARRQRDHEHRRRGHGSPASEDRQPDVGRQRLALGDARGAQPVAGAHLPERRQRGDARCRHDDQGRDAHGGRPDRASVRPVRHGRVHAHGGERDRGDATTRRSYPSSRTGRSSP